MRARSCYRLRVVPLIAKLAELHPRRFFGEAFAVADARRAEALASGYAAWKPAAVAVLGATVLLVLEQFGQRGYFFEHVLPVWAADDPSWAEVEASPRLRELWGKVWWSGFRVGGYLVLPSLFVRFVLHERVRDHGLGFGHVRDHLWIYGVGLLIVLPAVAVVSYLPAFQAKYPMYPYAGHSWTDFLVLTGLYAAQFLALEFFFRGHWVRAFEPVMGGHAITAMVIPYCMIHFGKPFGEALGSIAAGFALGALSIRSRSIYPGFLIHVTIGVAMDLAALAQKGQWPGG